MKKYILTLFALVVSNFALNATTMIIENLTPGAVCIGMISTSTLNGVNYSYVDQVNHCQFTIGSMDFLEFTDDDSNNLQFPFLNVYPFIGNVLQGPGLTSQLPLATLPLPFTDDNSNISPTRFQFEYMKYNIEGRSGNGDTGFGTTLNQNGYYEEQATYNDTLDLLTPPVAYQASFFKITSYYIFSFI